MGERNLDTPAKRGNNFSGARIKHWENGARGHDLTKDSPFLGTSLSIKTKSQEQALNQNTNQLHRGPKAHAKIHRDCSEGNRHEPAYLSTAKLGA